MKRIVVFEAHGDDMEFMAGGTIAKFADRGHEVTLVVATDNDKGSFELSGEISNYEGRGFCPRCGSRLLNPPDPGDSLIEIRIGSLDDAPFDLKPEAEIWVKRREAWLAPVDGAGQFDENRH